MDTNMILEGDLSTDINVRSNMNKHIDQVIYTNLLTVEQYIWKSADYLRRAEINQELEMRITLLYRYI